MSTPSVLDRFTFLKLFQFRPSLATYVVGIIDNDGRRVLHLMRYDEAKQTAHLVTSKRLLHAGQTPELELFSFIQRTELKVPAAELDLSGFKPEEHFLALDLPEELKLPNFDKVQKVYSR